MFTVFYRVVAFICMFASSTTLACSESAGDEVCIEKSSWSLGIALGVGIKTNPLVDGKNIPLVLLPDVAWYAEKAYFDNGELGYQWLNQAEFTVETYLQLDRESALFSVSHPANILFPEDNASNSVTSPGDTLSPILPNKETQDDTSSLSIDDVASRKWAINGGIRGHYYLSNGNEWQLSFKQDISNVHKGQQVGVQYIHRWLWDDFRFTLRTGTDWKSARVIDYYYGVSQRDTDRKELFFNGKSGWQTYMSLNTRKPINKNWSWLANIGYRRLPKSLTNSPLIAKNSIRNIFLGVAYRF